MCEFYKKKDASCSFVYYDGVDVCAIRSSNLELFPLLNFCCC